MGDMQKPLLALSVLAACSTSTAKPPVAPPAAPQESVVAELAQHRAQLIGWLHDYREAGVYPSDAAGNPSSVFIDASGVRCPMAELLHKSGRDDLVEAVAKEANTVRLADVHVGPLHDWMLASGLTQEEISLVQGAMNISFDWMPQELEEQQPGNQILAGKAAVRAKLEVAEMALRDSTGTSLVTARSRLGERRVASLAVAPIAGTVVPKTAIPRPVVVNPPRLVLRQRGYLRN
jgi:hypothetical protein